MIDLWAKRIQRLSLWNPSRACITDTVTSSASVIFGAIPTAGRHRLSCGDAFNSSSILQYSAVARVSRSTYTWPPWARCLGNVDHGRPRFSSLSRTPWNRSSSPCCATPPRPAPRRRSSCAPSDRAGPLGDEGTRGPGRRSARALLAAGRRDGLRHECEQPREDHQVDDVLVPTLQQVDNI